MAEYIDLRISKDDVTLDAGGQPVLLDGRASIAQDIQHMIRESGLLVDIIANRDARARRTNLVRITMAVDDDERIVPGTTVISESALGEYWLTATTVKYGSISLQLGA
ncbi:DUF2590 family protein [Nitratidesulfovibrio sp. HK-II]|uniref:DUF2590 family protein n=1 Tax=Nitratidesulfovibrio sp. HK-II TaxID=2009266 RepID=UPI0002275C8C|nr:DUF2590 family protein [Nitratidesulfovibrio sp. HK-II]EGY27467.1 hypothetical protein DA2_0198 [Desulfovibrio sp. A2]GBO96126.1 hypothetical protein RVX_1166 [Nitratidesulfovibrio sp. HK-II]